MSIDDILKLKLSEEANLSGGEWTIWERKTFNIHRAVVVWQPESAPKQYSEIPEIVRAKLAERFKVSWWRGMGFGFIAILPTIPDGIEACTDDIDTRENSKGTWQWSVLHFPNHKATIGAHMWMRGYLSSTYQQLIQHYQSEGNEVDTFKKEKDRLMKFLTTISVLPLDEYEDIPAVTRVSHS